MNDDLRQTRYERACWWLARGVDLAPLKPRLKNIQPGYGTYQAHITSTDFARRWFLNTDANLGVILGGAAGLAVADWDNTQDYESWRNSFNPAIETLTEHTARGYHTFFIGLHLPSATSNGCELKTSGVCMVTPSVHPSGVIYRIVQEAPLALLSVEKARLIFPFLSETLPEHNTVKGEKTPAASGRRETESGASLVQRIKDARSIVDELEAIGVRGWQRSGKNLVARCVFHHDDSPSLWVNPTSGLWGCNASSCPAHDGRRAHDVINARALWRSISNQEAIKQLADEFLPSGSKHGR